MTEGRRERRPSLRLPKGLPPGSKPPTLTLMDGMRTWIARALRRPLGGVVLTLVIALALGGVALADPGGTPNDHATQTSPVPSDDPSESSDEQEQESDDQGEPAAPHTETDCTDAVTDVHADLPAQDEATGLANAIYVVGANCEKNLQATGLVVALQHLVANHQRHQEHDAAKAAKAAAREGETHGNSGSSHGHSGEHGPPSSGS
jgi:hypothetical protein